MYAWACLAGFHIHWGERDGGGGRNGISLPPCQLENRILVTKQAARILQKSLQQDSSNQAVLLWSSLLFKVRMKIGS